MTISTQDALPVIPDDDSDFTPDLARKIIAKYQHLIAALRAPNQPVEATEQTLAEFICDVEDRLGPGCDELAIARAILKKFALYASPSPQETRRALEIKPAIHGHQYHDCIRFDNGGREVNGSRPTGTVPFYDQKTVDDLNSENLALTRALYEFETDYREQEKALAALSTSPAPAEDYPFFECPGCGRDIAESGTVCAPNCPRAAEDVRASVIEADYVKDICKRLRAGHQYSGITDPLDIAAANLIEALYLAALPNLSTSPDPKQAMQDGGGK